MPKLFLLFVFLAPFLGCASAPVKIGDGVIENSLFNSTGVTSQQVHTAQNAASLTIWDVYALSVDRTERLPLQAENLEQSLARRQQAGGAYLPHVSLTANAEYQDRSAEKLSDPDKTVALNARQPLFTGLNEAAALRGASHEVAQRRHEIRHEAGRLLLDVARSFYGVLQLEDSRASNQSIRALTQKQLTEIKRRVNLGRSRQSELLTVQAQLARLDAQVLGIEDNLSQARESLAVLAGIDAGQPLKATEAMKGASFELAHAEKQVEKRADVSAAREAVEVSSAGVLAAQGGHLPSLALDGKYYLMRDGTYKDVKWDAGISVDLPLFSGGQVSGLVREAKSRKRKAELALSQIRREAHQEIRSAYSSLAASLKEVDAYEKALKAAEDNYRVLSREFGLNLVTHLDVLRALSDLETARDNYQKVRYQTLVDRIWLDVAVGLLPKTTGMDDK